jgi:hypothetical protein
VTRKVAGGPVRLEQCRGHLRWRDDASGRVVHVHQLLALSRGADPGRVFSGGDWHVHHGNGVRWDNRPSNVCLEDGCDHSGLGNLPAGPWAANWGDLPAADCAGP